MVFYGIVFSLGADSHRAYTGSADHSYADMSSYNLNSQDSNSNFVYIDMTAGAQHMSLTPYDGYMDMRCGRRSPCLKGKF